jgi:hypothetical protein
LGTPFGVKIPVGCLAVARWAAAALMAGFVVTVQGRSTGNASGGVPAPAGCGVWPPADVADPWRF